MLAYIGPETILPLLSFFAGVAGTVLIFGRRAVDPVFRLLQRIRGRSE
jgi:hypothetical protein